MCCDRRIRGMLPRACVVIRRKCVDAGLRCARSRGRDRMSSGRREGARRCAGVVRMADRRIEMAGWDLRYWMRFRPQCAACSCASSTSRCLSSCGDPFCELPSSRWERQSEVNRSEANEEVASGVLMHPSRLRVVTESIESSKYVSCLRDELLMRKEQKFLGATDFSPQLSVNLKFIWNKT
jgi:hypothetical protein